MLLLVARHKDLSAQLALSVIAAEGAAGKMDRNFTKIFALIGNSGINIEQVERLRLPLYLSLSDTQYFG